MAAGAPGRALGAARGLLRALRGRKVAPELRREALQEFRRHAQEEDAGRVEALVRRAEDYAYLIRSVQHHQEVLLSYNISVDRRGSQRGLVERTAQRVGLQVPPEE